MIKYCKIHGSAEVVAPVMTLHGGGAPGEYRKIRGSATVAHRPGPVTHLREFVQTVAILENNFESRS